MSQNQCWIALPNKKGGAMVEKKNVYTKPGSSQRLVVGPAGKEILLQESNQGSEWFETEFCARVFCEEYWTAQVEMKEAEQARLESRLQEIKEELKVARSARRRAHNATYKWRKRESVSE